MPINITMPALSPTMTEGTLAKWLVVEGDSVESGQVIAEIETDKATMEVEAVDEGTIGKIVVSEGTEGVPVNNVIAVLLEDGESADNIQLADKTSDGTKADDKAESKPKQENAMSDVKADAKDVAYQPKQQALPQEKVNSSGRVFASPLAKRIAANKGLDLGAIKGSGPRGRIVKADVENVSETPQTGQTPYKAVNTPAVQSGEVVAIPNNNIKKITAKRLLESKTTVPHFYLTIDCCLDNLMAARKRINDDANGAYKVSVNDFIIKATAMALKAYPAANVQWTDDAVLQFPHADISVAVATPNGLMTPIVKAAETLGLKDISAAVKDLAGRAKDGKLKPEEFQGGTFTISNLGMFGIREFAAIINPPQSAILAVGAGEQRAVPENGEIKIKTMMTCTMSTDHRTIDGAVGAEFLQYFKRHIENPVSMLV